MGTREARYHGPERASRRGPWVDGSSVRVGGDRPIEGRHFKTTAEPRRRFLRFPLQVRNNTLPDDHSSVNAEVLRFVCRESFHTSKASSKSAQWLMSRHTSV